MTRSLGATRCRRASAAGGDRGWKHLTRQLPIPGQIFCGQSGQFFAGFWQGISPMAIVALDFAPAMASAYVEVNGTLMSAPNMAIMPRITHQFW
jgi:hypothetical protein